jgi:hypothetical protein
MKRCQVLCSLWLTATALLSLAVPAHAADAVDTRRQILVMLKMPTEHYRPGASYAGGYGASSLQTVRHRIAADIARRHGFRLENSWPMPLLGVDCYVMTLPDGVTPDAAVEQVSHERHVAWSEPLQLYQAHATSLSR